MENIKIVCLHPSIKNIQDMIKYLQLKDESLTKHLIWDENDPDYVVATEHIYKNTFYFNKFAEYYKKQSAIFIFQAGEAVFPDLTVFDYAIVINRKLQCLDRIIRIPSSIFYSRAIIEGRNTNTCSYSDAIQELQKGDKKFCNFIYSNPVAHPMRDSLFHALSKYKKVDSLGGHLKNVEARPTRREKNWGELSVDMKSDYKFSISSENAFFDGYTSEKLLTSYQAHSVPIYWGNPYVAEEFNEESFIDCNKYKTLEEIVERVKQIDNDDDLWAKMVSAPWQTPEQHAQMEKEFSDYQEFIADIFKQDINAARRRPEGTFAGMYREWFFRKYRQKNPYIASGIHFIKKKLKIAK